MTIHVFTTGGTFEKVYNPLDGSLTFTDSCLNALVHQSRSYPKPLLETIMLIDSLEMTDAHRQTIVQAVQSAESSHILIIHGTDTMVHTAQALAAAQLNKTIVLTGAMVPASIQESDALFNLGFAYAAVQLKPTGVYIAMNGQVHAANQVIKNKALGVFESIPSPSTTPLTDK